MVDFLRDAKDKDGKLLFAVYLLLLEKRESGEGDYDDPRSMNEVSESYVDKVKSFRVHANGTDVLQVLDKNNQAGGFNPKYDLLTDTDVEEAFPEDTDHEEYEGYQGNYGPTVQFWYHKGVVVFRLEAFHRKRATNDKLP